MILRVAENLYVGNTIGLAFTNKKEWAIIHSCQSYHYSIFNWNLYNRPKKEDPNYLVYEYNNELSLNWVDGDAHLYEWYGYSGFSNILNFIDKHIKNRKVFIHCDKGESRSPTIALLYMAKRMAMISNNSYLEAYTDFLKLYHLYRPGGIAKYVENNWDKIT